MVAWNPDALGRMLAGLGGATGMAVIITAVRRALEARHKGHLQTSAQYFDQQQKIIEELRTEIAVYRERMVAMDTQFHQRLDLQEKNHHERIKSEEALYDGLMVIHREAEIKYTQRMDELGDRLKDCELRHGKVKDKYARQLRVNLETKRQLRELQRRDPHSRQSDDPTDVVP